MDVKKARRQTLLSWLFVIVLVGLCAVLGALQYRWIGEVSKADRESLRERLEGSLRALSRDFDAEVTAACAALLPGRGAQEEDPEKGYELRYAQWRSTGRHPRLFRGIALVAPDRAALEGSPAFRGFRDGGRPGVPENWPGLVRGPGRGDFEARRPGIPPAAGTYARRGAPGRPPRGEDAGESGPGPRRRPPPRPDDGARAEPDTSAPEAAAKALALRMLDLDKGTFQSAAWPAAWTPLRDRLAARLAGDPGRGLRFFGPGAYTGDLIEIPVFNQAEGGGPGPWFARPREMAWLILELNLDEVRASLLPDLLQKHLGGGERMEYEAEVTLRDDPARLVYRSDPERASPIGAAADASVGLFEIQYDQIFRRGGTLPRIGGRGRGVPPAGAGFDRGRWLLAVRHRAGSLGAVVEQARRRNLAVTAAVLLLMLAAIGALVRYTARARRLAELQMEFVASVSHELRTPLTVIRTAAHNLVGGVVSSGKQVQRYGTLIEDEAEKLTLIVEQVLRFSNSEAGRAVGATEVLEIGGIVEAALAACSKIVEESRCTVEKHLDGGLPPVSGDPTALRHALQNLITNAAKYGADGGWIGVTAARPSAGGNFVEIHVADRGPGIPQAELGRIFDPFYRGRRALDDQIHGTGLGLSLVKRIIEAHGGTVTAISEPGKGAEFVLRIPASQAELIDEFANSSH